MEKTYINYSGIQSLEDLNEWVAREEWIDVDDLDQLCSMWNAAYDLPGLWIDMANSNLAYMLSPDMRKYEAYTPAKRR